MAWKAGCKSFPSVRYQVCGSAEEDVCSSEQNSQPDWCNKTYACFFLIFLAIEAEHLFISQIIGF